jgi:uncharacterized membrane protein HdeD (DUF308 family)
MQERFNHQQIEHETSLLQSKWSWCAKLGVALIFFGVLAISIIGLPDVNPVFLAGWLMVMSGIAEAIHAFHLRNSSAFYFHFVPAISGLPVGVLMVTHPAAGGPAWMLVFASCFTVIGIFRSISAFQLKFVRWKWVAFDGVVTLLLAATFWTTSLRLVPWFFPLAVGISLMVRGWSSIMFGMGLRSWSVPQPPLPVSHGQQVQAYVNRFLQRHSGLRN